MPEVNLQDEAFAELLQWYHSQHPTVAQEQKRFVVCTGLAVLEKMSGKFPLERSDFITRGNQLRTSEALIKKVLARFGESRSYAREGGRTTRGTVPAAEALVARLNALSEIAQLTSAERGDLVGTLQRWLVDRTKDYFDRRTIEVELHLDKPGPQIVGDILAEAKNRNQMGAVAQHLVGAKLALRFPNIVIGNDSFTTADLQTGREGDFLVGDTVIHVTVAPMPQVISKCESNIRNGYRAILLVLEARVQAAREMAELLGLNEKIGIHSLESFIGQNVEEMGEFGRANLATEFRLLIEEYNRRIAEAETDRSLFIEPPKNLK